MNQTALVQEEYKDNFDIIRKLDHISDFPWKTMSSLEKSSPYWIRVISECRDSLVPLFQSLFPKCGSIRAKLLNQSTLMTQDKLSLVRHTLIHGYTTKFTPLYYARITGQFTLTENMKLFLEPLYTLPWSEFMRKNHISIIRIPLGWKFVDSQEIADLLIPSNNCKYWCLKSMLFGIRNSKVVVSSEVVEVFLERIN